ncbi:S8 family serine peptidase [Plantactinospora sp. GCM10030261]|uniref:S8 family serine peptidase n=1 Tax=Plantactinospora sp. GCM10030261 TaxID=3273420 RepID=UPI00360E7C9E
MAGTLAGVLGTTGAVVAGPPAGAADDDPLRRVIVELADPAAIESVPIGGPTTLDARQVQRVAAARDALAGRHRGLVDGARKAGIRISDERSATLLVNTVAMRVPASQVARLSGLPGVVAVHPDGPVHTSVDVSVPLVGAPDVWKRKDSDGTAVRGRGITVAVVDTGVDYTHPDLGGGFGPGKRVVGGYDFANEDADPMDDNGHGTHVAGIAAGNGGVTGVAPEADLTAYKVMDAEGVGYASWVVAGLEAAVDPANPHRADVVNLSLAFGGDGTDPVGQAATAATRSGVVVVAAAGNGGPGPRTVTSPALAEGVISVGASTSGVRMPTARLESPVREKVQAQRAGISANPPAKPVSGEVVDVGTATPEELDRAGDLRGKVVVMFAETPVGGGGTPPSELAKAKEVERRGAIAALTYNEMLNPVAAPGTMPARPGTAESGDSFRLDRLVTLAIDPTQREVLARYLAKGPVRMVVEGTDVTDQLAGFSSRGPAPDFRLKPDLTAPGYEIRSTWPKAFWAPGEFRLSGTSMAAPHVAGAAVLLRQAHPEFSPAQVRAALVGSAAPLADLGPTQQGAGRLNVAKAVDARLIAEPATLSLGLADLPGPGSGTSAGGKVVVRNLSDKPARVTFTVQRAPGSIGSATVSPRTATIPAGGSARVTVSVTASAIDPDRDSDLSGWLVGDVAGTDRDLRTPYLLAARPLIVQSTPDPSDGTTEVFVWSPAPVRSAPTVRVISRDGRKRDVVAQPDENNWFRARLTDLASGPYRVEAYARATVGARLVGTDAFEVVAPPNRPGGRRWESVGPNSTAWQVTTIPKAPSRAVLSLAGSPALWLTDDRGATWHQTGRMPIAGGGMGSLVVDPTDDRRMWYAINGHSTVGPIQHVFDPTYHSKILYTEDRGRTWTTLDFADYQVFALLGSPDGKALVAVTSGGYHLSHDRGRTWVFHQDPFAPYLHGATLAGGTLLVAAPEGVHAVVDVFGHPKPARLVDPARSEDWIVGVAADEDGAVSVHQDGSVWGATDVTKPWTKLSTLPDGAFPSQIRTVNGDVYVACAGRNLVSQDGGRTWADLPSPINGPMLSDFDSWPDQPDSLLVSAEQGGLFGSPDKGSKYRRIGVPGLTAYDVTVARGPDGVPTLVAMTSSDSYARSLPTGTITPGDVEWGTAEEGRAGGGADQFLSTARDSRVVWKSLYYPFQVSHDIQRSTDGGRTWTTVTRTRGGLSALAAHPAATDRVVASVADMYGQGLLVSRDRGATWRTLYHGMTFDVVVGDPGDRNRLWLGNANGLYRSDDLGQTIRKVADGPVSAIHLGAGGRIVIGGDQIRVSGNGGKSFTIADTGGLPMRVSDVVAVPGSPNLLYAGTDAYSANGLPRHGRGVLRSADGGRTWENVSGGLQATSVTSLAVSPDGRWLFAGTVDAGVHRLPVDR